MYERILYVSRAAPETDQAEVYRIIRAAHARNRAEGLSGALVFLDGHFVQLLEGPAPAVAAGLARIRADRRHHGLELRMRERALCALFSGQAMALRTRTCLGEGVLAAFGYRRGFPAEVLPADALVEFLVAACHQTRPAAAAGR